MSDQEPKTNADFNTFIRRSRRLWTPTASPAVPDAQTTAEPPAPSAWSYNALIRAATRRGTWRS